MADPGICRVEQSHLTSPSKQDSLPASVTLWLRVLGPFQLRVFKAREARAHVVPMHTS